MEISGKILREVEFRDRLRGYDTDEVDEFLEKVAVAVDELRGELEQALRRAERPAPEPAAPRPVSVEPALDDDAIRRTLVLAQRTADLAVSEAREEAMRLLEAARSEAAETVTRAEDAARRTRDEADTEARTRLEQMTIERDRLEAEIQSLADIVGAERARLTDSLTRVLHSIGDALSVPDLLAGRSTSAPAPAPSPAVPAPSPAPTAAPPVGEVPGDAHAGDSAAGEDATAGVSVGDVSADDVSAPEEEAGLEDFPATDQSGGPMAAASESSSAAAPGVPDIETEIAEDAATAYGGGFFGGSTGQVRALSDEEADAEEELWKRWAAGRDLGVVPGPSDFAAGARRGRGSDGGMSA